MIKANELRIGNYGLGGLGEILTVDRLYSDGLIIWKVCETIDSCLTGGANPIPITEEWLKRFGFIKQKSGWCVIRRGSRKTSDLKMFHVQLLGNICNTKGGLSSGYRHIEYVHQLQNLYFALTGEELTLKQ